VATLYTRKAEDSGWLRVRFSSPQQTASGSSLDGFLCEYTKVETVRESGGRVFFKVADGAQFVGAEASLSAANAKKYLSDVGPEQSAALLSVRYMGQPAEEDSRFKGPLKQQWAELSFSGQTATITLNSVWDGHYTPIPAGTHLILAPDTSHHDIPTTGYVEATPGMIGNDVWFPIGLSGAPTNSSRYIHVGHLSEGCVTVHDLPKWSALYTYLISHRIPGSTGKQVGWLKVTK
jgi:hypothetical protein